MALKPQDIKLAFLVYRGNPRCGGQGVYTRYLTRELSRLGVYVEVFSGPPYPELDDGIKLNKVESLDLYRDPDPFRVPKLKEFKSLIDLLEFAIMSCSGFPEPLTFSLRARKLLQTRKSDFNLIHDNQCLGTGLLKMMRDGWPLIATIHHPITVDRELDLMHAKSLLKRLATRRWYGFLRMQKRVAQKMERVLSVSYSSRADVSKALGVDLNKISVVPVGVDHSIFRPMPNITKVPGRIMTTASADVPMKGLVPLLEAVAKLRTENNEAHLLVVGKLRPESRVKGVIERLDLSGAVEFVHSIDDQKLVELYAQAQVAVVPSLYEGFSLPAIEAMACQVPLVATTGGALPEVVGPNNESALTVEPNNPFELSQAISKILEDKELADRLGHSGRSRVLKKYTWQETARLTLENYIEYLESKRRERANV
jgi:glycosyltransferase involved in cell wall biosynthesis